jgi:UDP-N-acetylglucosamine--N-acetylmuramyl-(pentapeptide) pyrophosphoryl-undecaprenol N-acetylglucosamine transferase
MNARYLEERGAAILLEEADLPDRLLPLVRQLLGDPSRREAMSQAMKSLARPEAAAVIADLVQRLAADRTARGR